MTTTIIREMYNAANKVLANVNEYTEDAVQELIVIALDTIESALVPELDLGESADVLSLMEMCLDILTEQESTDVEQVPEGYARSMYGEPSAFCLEDCVIDKEMQSMLRDDLNVQQRAVYDLYVNGYSIEEVAQITKVSPEYVTEISNAIYHIAQSQRYK